MEQQKPLMEAVIPKIEFNGLKDWMDYNPLQTPVMFGWVIYGAGLAESAGSQTICVKTMGGARAWAGTDTWKKPKDPTVNNDGLKLAPKEECGSVSTGKGLFPIKIDGFFNMGNPLLVVKHNGKIMHSFDNGIPIEEGVMVRMSVKSGKVYTLRMAEQVMNRAQKNAFKAAMLHQQLLLKKTLRLAAKRWREKQDKKADKDERQRLRKSEQRARQLRLQLQHREQETAANIAAVKDKTQVQEGEHDSPPRSPSALPDRPSGHGGVLDIVDDDSDRVGQDRSAARTPRRHGGSKGKRNSVVAPPPESAVPARSSTQEEQGPSGHGGVKDNVDGVGDDAVFEGRVAGPPKWADSRDAPAAAPKIPKWEKGWGFGVDMSQVRDENSAALRGWNELEEKEVYEEPTNYLDTEMAVFVPRSDAHRSPKTPADAARASPVRNSSSPPKSRLPHTPQRAARKLLQADEVAHVDAQTSWTSGPRHAQRDALQRAAEEHASESAWSPPPTGAYDEEAAARRSVSGSAGSSRTGRRSPGMRPSQRRGQGRRGGGAAAGGVMQRLRHLRRRWQAAGGHARAYKGVEYRGFERANHGRQWLARGRAGAPRAGWAGSGWNIAEGDLRKRRSRWWSVTGDRERRRGGLGVLGAGKGEGRGALRRETLKVMDHADAATSHKTAKDNGRTEQRVYRGRTD
jgi:hypothetical protein